jgi:transcriptional regulator with XRE-family HTH domain
MERDPVTALLATFGARLRQSRKVRGWTQSELADAANLSLDMIGRLERGHTAPSFESIAILAKAVGAPPAALLGGSEIYPKTDTDRSKALRAISRYLAKASDADLRRIERVVAALLKD